MADSVVLDFHKMLLTPGLNTLVMFRDGARSYETFDQKAGYLFEKNDEKEWFNGAKRTLECTKSGLGITAWAVIKFYGDRVLGEYIDSRYDLARRFGEALRKLTRKWNLLPRPSQTSSVSGTNRIFLQQKISMSLTVR